MERETPPDARPPRLTAMDAVRGLYAMPPEALKYLADSDATESYAGKTTALLVLGGLSHMFKRVPAGTDSMATFGWPGPCDERVAEGVARWSRSLR